MLVSASNEVRFMKKKTILPGFLSLLALCGIIAALLFPLGTGLTSSTGDAIIGYDLVFGNEAMQLNDPHGAMIAWFVLLLIAAFFGVIGAITGFFGSKFGAFLNFLTGLICVICALLFFLSSVIAGSFWLQNIPNATVSLGWGYLAAGIASAVAALLDLFVGVRGLMAKQH